MYTVESETGKELKCNKVKAIIEKCVYCKRSKEKETNSACASQQKIHRVLLAFELSLEKSLGVFKSDESYGIT